MPRSRRAPGYFQRRGKTIRWRVDLGKRTHTETFRTTSLPKARAAARKRYVELEKQQERIDRGMLDGERRYSDMSKRFKAERLPTLTPGTIRSYLDSLKPLDEFFIEGKHDPKLADIRRAHITEYLTWRRVHRAKGKGPGTEDRPLGGRTLAKDRAVLHKMFADAEGWEWRDGNPVSHVKPPKADTRQYVILTDTQFEKLLAKCPDTMTKLYLRLLGETGIRCESEGLWCKWEDVDLVAGFIEIVSGRGGHRTKSGKSRWVPMTARLRATLRQHFQTYRFNQYDGAASPWLFHHTLTRRHHRAGERITSLRRSVMDAAKAAKLPEGWTQHDLRHRRVTTWLAEGKSPVLVKEALGHSDLRTTMAYTHLSREHLRVLVEAPTREQLKAELV